MHTQPTLTRFLKEQCANCVNDDCLLDDAPCDVLAQGTRCGYFERCVLGPADYPYKQPGYDYAKLFGQYAELTKAKVGKVRQRRCACGEPLQLRQRFCAKCRKIRARATNRERVRKHRHSNSLNVTL